MSPLLLDMQNRVHDYVVADKGTSQKALDALVKDWNKVFKQEGKEIHPDRTKASPASIRDLPRRRKPPGRLDWSMSGQGS